MVRIVLMQGSHSHHSVQSVTMIPRRASAPAFRAGTDRASGLRGRNRSRLTGHQPATLLSFSDLTATTLALVLGFFALTVMFSDLLPAIAPAYPGALSLIWLYFPISGFVVGTVRPKRWWISILVGWSSILLGADFLLPAALALAGGRLARALFTART